MRRPIAADNAAMEVESIKAEPPKRKCRWFQFSLRTLLIGVTLLCVACANLTHELKIVQQRRDEWNRSVNRRQVLFRKEDDFGVLNWTRRALGDKVVYIIYLPEETDPAELARLHAIFPEGRIRLYASRGNPGYSFVWMPPD
jgi:hypothetical protein